MPESISCLVCISPVTLEPELVSRLPFAWRSLLSIEMKIHKASNILYAGLFSLWCLSVLKTTGLYDDLKSKLNLKLFDASKPSKGFEYLYLTDEDYNALPEGAVNAHKVPEGWAIDDIIGTQYGIGVENLQGSGKIAGETSQAYDDTFTLSFVTGRSVGIGAYLVRLGQRIIQKTQGPIILTGFSALNKLLGREVYSSQDRKFCGKLFILRFIGMCFV